MTADIGKDALRRAKSLFDQGKMDEARNLLREAQALDPNDVKVLTFLAYLHYRLGDLQESRILYRRLTAMDQKNLSLWSNLGLVAYKLGLWDEARECFDACLAISPQDAKILSYQGMVMAKIGKQVTADTYQRHAEESAGAGLVEAAQAAAAEKTDRAAAVESQEEVRGVDDGTPLDEWCRAYDGGAAEGAGIHAISTRVICVRLENRITFSLPCLLSYSGVVLFEQGINPYGRIPRKHRHDALVLLSSEGNGRMWLTHKVGWLVTLRLEQEPLIINAFNLVAFDTSLECRWLPLGKDKFLSYLAPLKLSGEGKVVLAAGGGLVSSLIKPGAPHFVKPRGVVAWTEGLECAVDDGEDLKRVKEFFDSPFLRFEGLGRIFLAGTGYDIAP